MVYEIKSNLHIQAPPLKMITLDGNFLDEKYLDKVRELALTIVNHKVMFEPNIEF